MKHRRAVWPDLRREDCARRRIYRHVMTGYAMRVVSMTALGVAVGFGSSEVTMRIGPAIITLSFLVGLGYYIEHVPTRRTTRAGYHLPERKPLPSEKESRNGSSYNAVFHEAIDAAAGAALLAFPAWMIAGYEGPEDFVYIAVPTVFVTLVGWTAHWRFSPLRERLVNWKKHLRDDSGESRQDWQLWKLN